MTNDVRLTFSVGDTTPWFTWRATSHTRLTIITLHALSLVEKVELVPSLPYTTLEGPTEYVNAR